CRASMPADSLIRDIFVANLKPRRLGERVLVRSPSTLAEAKSFALEEAESLVAVAHEAAALATPVVTAQPRGVQRQNWPIAVPNGNPQAAVPVRPPIVCHGCGERGHKRFECPRRAQGVGGSSGQLRRQSASVPARAPLPATSWPSG